ncbi:hypothetical protein RhiirA4_462133 [Rhizophagus irregularis]|uniref:Uncharacterized protein n=1 Tax=Rhizophagus irregularis TaxID=588596 RepID=A0A2I1GKA3_9GLOM|nr:hypothetical protein RhiirA4_462133 [Rhizophagus irregularis]
MGHFRLGKGMSCIKNFCERCNKKHGVLENPNKKKAGRKFKLHQEGIMKLYRFLLKKPDWYLDELAAKLSRKAKERNEIERISFIMRMKNFSLEQLVFVDETAKDERSPFTTTDKKSH